MACVEQVRSALPRVGPFTLRGIPMTSLRARRSGRMSATVRADRGSFVVLLADSTSSATLIGWVIGVVIWILLISWTAAIARRKGRSPFLWGVFAFFFSLIALVVILLMPSRRTY